MRKILIIVIMILLVVLGFITMRTGIGIGNFKVLSIPQISEQNKQLEAKIEEVNNLNEAEFPKKIADLKEASKNLEEAKKEYLKYTSLSSNDDILAAMQQKKYRIESLWVKLGTHAKKEGVILEFKIIPSSIGAKSANDINFTVNGNYVAIINFVYAIENDADLNFKIENFKLEPSSEDKNGNMLLKATFKVRNVSLKEDTLSKEAINTSTENNAKESSSITENSEKENSSTTENSVKENTIQDNHKDKEENNITNELEQTNSNEIE